MKCKNGLEISYEIITQADREMKTLRRPLTAVHFFTSFQFCSNFSIFALNFKLCEKNTCMSSAHHRESRDLPKTKGAS